MRILPGLCIFLIVLASCHKSNSNAPTRLYGQWLFTKEIVSGPGTWTNYAPSDSAVILHLNLDNSYSYTLNGRVVSAGTFQAKLGSGSASTSDQLILHQSSGSAVNGDFNYTLHDGFLILDPNLLNPGLHWTYYYVFIP